MENDFIVSIKGTTLTIELGKELTTANSPALTQELSKYRGQDINKVVFDASRLQILCRFSPVAASALSSLSIRG
jgi:anti-anti-sigma regulatory factor